MTFAFWYSDKYGLIRQRSAPGKLWHPEVWRNGHWQVGSSYVMDAITGMGEDPHSCGEYSDKWDQKQAEAFAAQNGIALFAENPEEPAR